MPKVLTTEWSSAKRIADDRQCLQHGKSNNPELTAIVVQQPILGRVSGHKFSDIRPVDPPPVVAIKFSCSQEPNLSFHHLICLVSLWTADKKQENNSYTPRGSRLHFDIPPSQLPELPRLGRDSAPLLAGDRVSICYGLVDDKGINGYYFVFPRISVKCCGEYSMKFQIFDLQMPGRELASCFSNPFKIYTPLEFPGYLTSTPLSRAFSEQGIHLVVREDPATKSKERNKHSNDR